LKHIIIPTANTTDKCKEYLDNCLASIRAGGYYENGYHVIIAYDNVDQEFQDYFKKKYNGDFIVAIDNKNVKNLNFAANSNSGLRIAYQAAQSTGDTDAHFIILNMDTILPPARAFNQVLGEGLSFPTPVDYSPKVDPESLIDFSDLQGKVQTVLDAWGARESKDCRAGTAQRTPVTKFSGFCMCLSYKLVEKIGFLDEHFPGSFNDDCIAARALLAGFPVEVVSVDVHHELKNRTEPSNTGAYDHAELGLGLEKFRRKYSIPHYIQHEQFNNWIVDNHKWIPEMRCL